MVHINLSVSESVLFLDSMSYIFMFDAYQCFNYFWFSLDSAKRRIDGGMKGVKNQLFLSSAWESN